MQQKAYNTNTRYWEQKAKLAHENNLGKLEKNNKSSNNNNNNNASSSNNNSNNNNSGKKNNKKSDKGCVRSSRTPESNNRPLYLL
jgi:hypothetical protein